MTEINLRKLACDLSALSIFRGVAKSAVLSALRKFLICNSDPFEKMSLYGEFVALLSETEYSLSDYLVRAVCEDENSYITGVAAGEISAIKTATEKLQNDSYEVFGKIYQQQQAQQGAPGAGFDPNQAGGQGFNQNYNPGAQNQDDNVVDADYETVD